MKNDFYIFIAFNGVLNSKVWFKKFKEFKLAEKGYSCAICPDNIIALNSLVNKISKRYNVKFVFTSLWRMNIAHTKKLIVTNGLNASDAEFIIIGRDDIRGLSIKKFIDDKKLIKNYLVIEPTVEGELSDIRPYIPSNKIIQTDTNDFGLTEKILAEYFNKLKNEKVRKEEEKQM
ncbi:MAG: hypothetical protein WCX32_00165 [Clostridia bacterium]|jgi:hypothetical protein|nr:hypothetical protein [Clostridia bacterium]MDD4275559.1 hypothetical protein [Clostridia bacterium]